MNSRVSLCMSILFTCVGSGQKDKPRFKTVFSSLFSSYVERLTIAFLEDFKSCLRFSLFLLMNFLLGMLSIALKVKSVM